LITEDINKGGPQNLPVGFQTLDNFDQMIGQSLAWKNLLTTVEAVAPTDVNVLVHGETGTEKELIAHVLHNLSARKDGPFIKVHCGLLTSVELFGDGQGISTRSSRKIVYFEKANGGTIFLENIDELPQELQARFVKVLHDGESEQLIGLATIKISVRVIAATSQDIEKLVLEERFRKDLFCRLNLFPVRIPPLRERREDIPLFIRNFVSKYGEKYGKRIETIPQETMDVLQSYPWPGNMRELENIIERAAIISKGSSLDLGDWLRNARELTTKTHVLTLEEAERRHILEVMELTSWRVSGERGAARLLNVKPTTLESRIKKLGIKKP